MTSIAEPAEPTPNSTSPSPEPARVHVGGKRRYWRRADLTAAIVELTNKALGDPRHPWNLQWPTAREMAEAVDSNAKTVGEILRALGTQGLYVKVRVQRDTRAADVWIPAALALNVEPQPTTEGMIAEIIELGRVGEWTFLPSYDDLEKHFRVTRPIVTRVVKTLAQRGLITRRYYRNCWRWRLTVAEHAAATVELHRIRSPGQRAIVDLERRLKNGEFRYSTPDGVVHEEPFLSSGEIAAQYRIGRTTAKDVINELLQREWLTRSRPHAACELSDRVPTVARDRPTPPRQRPVRGGGRRRARELIDLIAGRIVSGEFARTGLPSGARLIAEYGASRRIMQQVFAELHRLGLIDFEEIGGHQHATLAARFRASEAP